MRPADLPDPGSVAADLARLVEGEVRFDTLSRTLYSTAACIYQIQPLGVVVPRHEDDARAVVDYARRHRVPVTARGGGSGLAGQTLGRGIILDFSRHFRRIADIDPAAGTVRVQPGVIQAQLNRVLRRHGVQFAPDPSSSPFCTLGGMIANNGGGSHTIRHGATRENAVSLRVLTADGSVFETRPIDRGSLRAPPASPAAGPAAAPTTDTHTRLVAGLAAVVDRHRDLIEARQPRTTRNSSGYALREAAGERVDLAKTLIGSEGTLALVLDSVLRVVPLPRTKATALILFDDLEKAGAAVVEILAFSPSALELLDATFVQVIREASREVGASLPHGTEAILIAEIDGDDDREVRGRMAEMSRRVEGRLATEVRRSARPEDTAAIWAIRKAASPILSRREGTRRNTRFIEDAAVRPDQMAEFVRRMRALLAKHGLQAAIFGHAGDCNLHCNPMMNQKDPRDLARMEAIAAEFTDLVVGMGGSLSGEHGDGRLRTPYLRRAYGPLVDVFGEVKTLFDPAGLFNPGIIVHDDSYGLTDDLRYGDRYRRTATATAIDEPAWQTEIEKCHGCGTCRDYCPVAAESGAEEATARAKANLLRAVISGRLDPGVVATAEFRSVMDLCVNCRLCHSECPTAIDIPGMVIMAKEIHARAHGRSAADRVLTSAGPLLRAGTLLAPIANAVLASGPIRSAMSALTGVAARRWLQPFAADAIEVRLPSVDPDGRKVAYFHGCFGGYQDAEGEGRAAIELLERLGCAVAVPPQECCGIASITYGHLDDVRGSAARNVATFLDFVRRGYTVVHSAPSCGLALVEDYPRLLGTPGADVLARHVRDIHAYVLEILEAEPDLRARLRPVPLRMTYHNPCHMQSRGEGAAVVRLLRMVPGVEVVPIEKDHCCGIAGTFGMKEKNFDLSLRIGRPLFEELHATGAPLVATGCGTCKIQIEQGSGLPVVHPARVVRDSLAGTIPSFAPPAAARFAGPPVCPAAARSAVGPASPADDASDCPE